MSPAGPRRRSSTATVVLLAALVLQCARPAPEDGGEYGRQEGRGCGDARPECRDDETLWVCVERRWELVDCADRCAEHGGAVGCDLADPTLGARCLCEDDSADCDPAQSRCTSDEAIEVCDPGALRFVEHTCEALCASLAPPHLSEGCLGDACRCTTLGTPCAPGSPPRCETFGLVRCVEGTWAIEDCAAICGGPGTCDPWGPDGAGCVCKSE